MSFHVKDDFRDGMPFAAVGVEWYNRVAGFLNALVGGLGIIIFKPSHPAVGAPVFIDIDPMAVADALRTGKTLWRDETEFKDFETPSAVDSAVSDGHALNALLDTAWTRGDVDANRNPVGVKVYLPTDSWGDGVSRSIAWRLCEFDRFGCLQKVGAQTIRTESVNMDQLKG